MDLENYPIHLRQQLLHQTAVPLFQRLRHNGVIGVVEHLLRNGQRLVKGNPILHQQPDQLRNGDHRVGIVQLDADSLRQVIVLVVGCPVFPQDIRQGCGAEEILLLEPQQLPLPGVVVGVQDSGNILCGNTFRRSLQIMLLIEQLEVKGMHRLRLPQPQGTDVPGLAADDGHIIGHCPDGLSGVADLHRIRLTAHRPGISPPGPVIGGLLLEAVLKMLLKQPVPVTDAVAVQGQVQSRRTVQKACSQSAQPPVAQGSIRDLIHSRQGYAVGTQGFFHGIVKIQAQQIVLHSPPHQKFHGEIARPSAGQMRLTACPPVRCNGLHHRVPDGTVQCLGSRLVRGGTQLFAQRLYKFLMIHLYLAPYFRP